MKINFSPTNACSSGQIFPLLTLLLALIFIGAIGVTQFLLRAHSQVVSDERNFQRVFIQEFRAAFVLNSICENNQRIAKTLANLVDQFLSGSAYLLDVAASVPVWEKGIPISLAGEAFARFDTTSAVAVRELMQLKISNEALVNSTPDSVRFHLHTLSTREAICALTRGHFTNPDYKTMLIDCPLSVRSSFLAQPRFRTIHDLSMLIDSVGSQVGLVHIAISDNFTLKHITAGPTDREFPDPFSRKAIMLTHAQSCELKAKSNLKKLCPTDSAHSVADMQLARNEKGSFETHWSIFVKSE